MKLEINNRIEFEKCTTILKINNAVLNNQQLKKITGEIRKYLEMNEHTIRHNLCRTVKVLLRGKFTAVKCLY